MNFDLNFTVVAADGVGHHITPGVMLGLCGSDLAAADHLHHQTVVPCQPIQLSREAKSVALLDYH